MSMFSRVVATNQREQFLLRADAWPSKTATAPMTVTP